MPTPIPTPLRFLLSGLAWRKYIDGPDHLLGPYSYSEQGYIEAMIIASAYSACLYNKEQALDIAALDNIHQLSLHRVGSTNYDQEPNGTPRSIRQSRSMSFILRRNNSSRAGYIELLRLLKNNERPSGKFRLFIYDRYSPTSQGAELTAQRLRDPEYTSEQWADYLLTHEVCYSSDNTTYSATHVMEDLLVKLHAESFFANTDQKRSRTVATFCQDGARAHPYLDGNGRSFCMLLPDILSVRSGLDIGLYRDVNHIANFAIAEVVAEMTLARDYAQAALDGSLPGCFTEYYVEPAQQIIALQKLCRKAAKQMATILGTFEKVVVAAYYNDVAYLRELRADELATLSVEDEATIIATLDQHDSFSVLKKLIRYGVLPATTLQSQRKQMQIVERTRKRQALTHDEIASLSPARKQRVAALYIEQGNRAEFETLLRFKSELNLEALLIAAVRHNKTAMTCRLLSAGANPSVKFRGQPLLTTALFNQNDALITQFKGQMCPQIFNVLFISSNKCCNRFLKRWLLSSCSKAAVTALSNLRGADGHSVLYHFYRQINRSGILGLQAYGLRLNLDEYSDLVTWLQGRHQPNKTDREMLLNRMRDTLLIVTNGQLPIERALAEGNGDSIEAMLTVFELCGEPVTPHRRHAQVVLTKLAYSQTDEGEGRVAITYQDLRIFTQAIRADPSSVGVLSRLPPSMLFSVGLMKPHPVITVAERLASALPGALSQPVKACDLQALYDAFSDNPLANISCCEALTRFHLLLGSCDEVTPRMVAPAC